ncbi:unnamed protein product [Camellia sinensis]
MAETGYWLRGRSLNLNLNQSSKAEEAKKSFKLPFVWATKTRTRNEEFSLIRRKNQRSPRRLVKIATSSSNKGRWNGKWTSEYIFSLQQLHLQDLVEGNEDGDGNGNDNGNGGGRDTQVSITLSIEKHASFGLSVNGRIIITSLTRKCCNCSSPYSRKIDTEFNVWVLQSSRHSGTTTHHLPEIGADDPSVIYVKAGGEADLDSLIQDAIRLATSVNETCSESCEKSDQPHVVGEQKAASIDKRWSRLLELRNSF